ncbi:hypothetical protein FQN57_003519 [Myotisia sp. PD_48]|nr:hypothetical protein FQN57_003519 [Myotisia sp. PD_48]
MQLPERPAWQQTARKVQAHRDASIAKVDPPSVPDPLPRRVIGIPRQLLTTQEITITESSPELLVAALAAGKLSATKVTKAFLRRAAIAQRLVNCVYELLSERALARAKELDDHYAQHKKPIGPLHGLPISIKEHIGLEGLDNTAGFVGWVGQKSEIDSSVVKLLLDAGAVVYVRTTEPQGLMMIETNSNTTGVTVNPHNTSLTPGGSSGGESALLSLFGSPLGIGSDIGGCIRSPAGNCAIYGFKPTNLRIPLLGIKASDLGQETILGTVGPLSTTLGGIELFMKTVLETEPWKNDPSLHQMPWRSHESLLSRDGAKKFTIGVMRDDGIIKPLPPVQRALAEVVEKLKLVPGIEVIEWEPYKHDEAIEMLKKLYFPDGGKKFYDCLKLSGEPPLPLIDMILNEPGVECLNLQETWNWTLKREMFRYFYLEEWNKVAQDMDVILCPVHPNPAPPIDTSRYWGYTSVWNLLDYPAIVFPVTRVDPVRDVKDPNYKPRSDLDKWYQDHYDPILEKDGPVPLQLVAKKLQDEKVVRACRDIVEAIGLPFVNCLEG